MNSAFYRQDIGRTSVLLQQVTGKKDSRGILMACVCTADEACVPDRPGICRRLLHLFREEILAKNAGNIEGCRNRIEKILKDEAKYLRKDKLKHSYSGMLCIDSGVLLFAAGDQRIYLINSVFMRPQLELILGEGDFYTPRIVQAEIERGAGVLLGTEPFYKYMDERLIKECLFVKGDKDGKKTERHLDEYGRYMESLGGRDMGAVIVRTV